MPTKMNPLPSIVRAAAHDAGSNSMRAAGRSSWNDDDWNAMCAEQDRLIKACYSRAADTSPLAAFARFGHGEAMQRAGLLTLSTKNFHEALDASFDAYAASFDVAA